MFDLSQDMKILHTNPCVEFFTCKSCLRKNDCFTGFLSSTARFMCRIFSFGKMAKKKTNIVFDLSQDMKILHTNPCVEFFYL